MSVLWNRIYVGSLSQPDYVFENDMIRSAGLVQNVALVGQSLSIDTFTPVVSDSYDNVADVVHFRTGDGREILTGDRKVFAVNVGSGTDVSDLIRLPYGTPVWYYQEDTLVGKFFVENVERVGSNAYQMNTVSAIGILDRLYHGGGLFTATTFGAVLTHILAAGLHGTGSAVIEYELDEDVADLPVSGWLPYDTKRNNLYQLLFANGVNIVKGVSGNPRFTFIFNSNYAEGIPDGNVFDSGSVEYESSYSKISILEHTYTAVLTEERQTLFDNTSAEQVTNREVWFQNAPVIVSTITAGGNLTVVSATENSAVITGSGTLTGIPYLHATKSVEETFETGAEDRQISVTNCTLVNMINSENLMARLSAFYSPEEYIEKIKNSIVYSGERCGKRYAVMNPFRVKKQAYLASMNINVSSFNRADCEFYGQYQPAGQQGLYQNCIVLDKDTYDEDGGVFTVPEAVLQTEEPSMRVVLIPGGTGGSSGWPGANGSDARVYTNVKETDDISSVWFGAEGGAGGSGGDGGSPGQVLSVTIDNPAATYNYTIGSGGAGGDPTGFIPDTAEELKAALEAEHPGTEYTAAQITEILAEETALTDWDGSPNAGTAGTATTFGGYSSEDEGGYVPTGGVYNPIFDAYYALPGSSGTAGGQGGARRVEDNTGLYTYVTDGQDVTNRGESYQGGVTGPMLNRLAALPDAKFTLYGGNGAGGAVGINRTDHLAINGGGAPPMLTVQYTYGGNATGFDLHLLPGGKAYSFSTRYTDAEIGGERYVLRPTSAAVTGTMGTTDATVQQATEIALHLSEEILDVKSVDELSMEDGIVTIAGMYNADEKRNIVSVTMEGALSGRYNDPLNDPDLSYHPADQTTVKTYGCGGDGGHGGGGGAGASTVILYENTGTGEPGYTLAAQTRRHGYGSGGGKGGAGGDGCILIFY